MLEPIAVFLFVVLLIYYFVNNDRHLKELAKKIPGPKGYPFVGNGLMFLGKPNDVLRRLHQISCEYKRLVALWFGPKLTVVLFDARDIEVMLKDRRAMEKSEEYRFLKPWLGDSILISAGVKFRTNKKIMMPTFHTNSLKNHIELFNVHARNLVQSLKCEIGKEEFDIHHYLYHTMLGELMETTLGVNHETLGGENLVKYGIAVSQLCKITHIRYYKIWLRPDSLFRFSKLKRIQDEALSVVHPLTEKVITERKKELQALRRAQKLQEELISQKNQETGENHLENFNEIEEEKFEDFNKDKRAARKAVLLDLLLEAKTPEGRNLTDQEIKDEVLTIMFAGQDTTSVSVGFMLSLLGLHTDVQDKLYAELNDIFGDSNRMATYEDLQRMEYLERVMQETWRLYPPIPVIARKTNDDIPLETCVLPKGCTVAIITMLVHRNPEFFENPHRFDPDNFLPEKIKSRHPYCFIPFSGGVRTCVGAKYAALNIKVLISTLLRIYRIKASRIEKDYKLVAETTLKRKEGFLIGLELRKNEDFYETETVVKDKNDNSIIINNKNNKDIPKTIFDNDVDVNSNHSENKVSLAA